jgi:collagenase-like PrtC family protease
MKYFSVPADFKTETIDRYAVLNDAHPDSKVNETYGNITIGNKFGSGRTSNLLPETGFDDLARYVAHSNEKGIPFNYTLNASHMENREFSEEGAAELKAFLGQLHETGVRSLTVTLPSVIELVQALPYDFTIKASAVCSIDNVDKAMAYKRMGIRRIVADESINRDFTILERILERFGDGLELIANGICYKNCIYRMFHYNQSSTDSVGAANKISCDYYVNRCVLQRYNQVSNVLRINWIRPEDIHYYTRIGITRFKLQGRQSVIKGDPVKALEHYFNEDYSGDLMQLLDMFNPMTKFRVFIDNKKLDGFLEPFYKKKYFCGNDCEDCRYCDLFAEKSIDYKKAEETVNMAKEFYEGYDDYRDIINRDSKNVSAKKLFNEDIGDLNFEFEG